MTLREQTFRYCRPTGRNDHFDDAYLEERERAERRGELIRCHHPKCTEIKFQHLDWFRRHVHKVHGVLPPSWGRLGVAADFRCNSS